MSRHAAQEKRARALFSELMDQRKLHVRVGAGRNDVTEVRFIGTAAELHGPQGCCSCCHGRTLPREFCPRCKRRLAASLRVEGITVHPSCEEVTS